MILSEIHESSFRLCSTAAAAAATIKKNKLTHVAVVDADDNVDITKEVVVVLLQRKNKKSSESNIFKQFEEKEKFVPT